MQIKSVLSLIVIAFICTPARAQQDDAGKKLHALFDEHFAWLMNEFPGWAMSRGDYTNAHRLADSSLAAINRRHRTTRTYLDRIQMIDKADLSPDDLINYELFELDLKTDIDGHRFRTFLAPVGQRSGPHQSIPQMAERVRFNTYADYDNYIKRLIQVPKAVADTIERMKIGLAEKRTQPRITLAGLPDQFKAVLEGKGLDALAKPLADMPDTVSDSQKASIERRFNTDAMPAVRKALATLRDFVLNDYIPHCRTSIAAKDLPDGPAYYAHQLRKFTTTDKTAKDIHDLGLSEVARIQAEMMTVIRTSDFMKTSAAAKDLNDADLFAAFVKFLREDKRFYYDDPDALLAGYRDICKRVDAWLPKFFKTLPRLTYGVRAIPDFMAPSQTTAYYWRGDIRNAQPGWFYANTYALDQRPKYEMTALALHEAVPGHHLQIALAQELEGLPEFRKTGGFTAFVEGWGLYAERIGLDAGMYEDPYDNFGRLLYEMWRACRLVVDTGMHAFDWPRNKAVNFMLAHTALSTLNVNTEIDRYIGWPGQATAYKIGELTFRRLREKSRKTLGEEFDIREYHHVVLSAGALPMSVLESRVDRWLAKAESKTARK